MLRPAEIKISRCFLCSVGIQFSPLVSLLLPLLRVCFILSSEPDGRKWPPSARDAFELRSGRRRIDVEADDELLWFG